MYFGYDVAVAMETWWEQTFVPSFHEKYGSDAAIAVVVLNNLADHDWQNPYRSVTLELLEGTAAKLNGDEGLMANVVHKLRFTLRTGLDSSEARQRPDLVEPGDFPYAGAGTYRGYTGGASGLFEESDWWVFCRVVDKLIEVRALGVADPIKASHDRVPGGKYLEGDWSNRVATNG